MVTFLDLGKYGRIGNQMFQIAGTIGIAERMGYSYGFPYWRNYDHQVRFGFSEDIDIQKWFKNPLPELEDGSYPEFNVKWGYHEVSPPDNVSLKGHFQSERYFNHCAEKVKHYFTFVNEKPKQTNTIGVHVRCGDYGGDYHPICSPEYYAEALAFFPSSYTVLLFSDNPKAAHRIVGKGDVIQGNHSMEDMALMASCDNHIIANSTFSWWAAWLADSRSVVAPKKWFGPAAKISSQDIYCKGWLVI